jgi:tRNA A37 threonylcarbamoyladenosine modification protein TsaB
VAIALAQGWELAREVRLLGVSSVECLAWGAWLEGQHGDVAAVVDAQRGEYYAERYQITHDGVEVVTELGIVSPEMIRVWVEDGVTLIGPDLVDAPWTVKDWRPEAGMLGVLAWKRSDFVHSSALEPIYLRTTQFVKAPPPRTIPPAQRPLH